MKNRIIGIYELLASAFGIYAVVQLLLFRLDTKNVIFYSVTLIFLYGIVGIAGLLLLIAPNTSTKVVLWANILAQSLQIINFSLYGIEYTFQAGTTLGFKLNQDLKLIFNLFEVVFKISIVSEENFLLFNGFPMMIIFLLLKQKNSSFREQV